MCVSLSLSIYTHPYTYVFTYLYIYIHMYIYICIFTYVCIQILYIICTYPDAPCMEYLPDRFQPKNIGKHFIHRAYWRMLV